MDTDSITIPLRLLLDELLHTSYRDTCSVSPATAELLIAHSQHDTLYHVEEECSGSYRVWTKEAWDRYVDCDYSWQAYIDKFFAEYKKRVMQGGTQQISERKTTNVKQRIKALEDKDPFGSALLRGLFKDI